MKVAVAGRVRPSCKGRLNAENCLSKGACPEGEETREAEGDLSLVCREDPLPGMLLEIMLGPPRRREPM